VVPVLTNRVIFLKFVIDSGASDVSIPVDVVATLLRTGTLQESDFIGTQTLQTCGRLDSAVTDVLDSIFENRKNSD
jgi:hypothetical protein